MNGSISFNLERRTLGRWRKFAALILGEEHEMVKGIDRVILKEGEDSYPAISEQGMHLLLLKHLQEKFSRPK